MAPHARLLEEVCADREADDGEVHRRLERRPRGERPEDEGAARRGHRDDGKHGEEGALDLVGLEDRRGHGVADREQGQHRSQRPGGEGSERVETLLRGHGAGRADAGSDTLGHGSA